MNGTWELAVQFTVVTTLATAIGVLVYLRVNPESWPLTTRVGTGFDGAAIGTFAGGLLLLVLPVAMV
jgi:hypothetical protein